MTRPASFNPQLDFFLPPPVEFPQYSTVSQDALVANFHVPKKSQGFYSQFDSASDYFGKTRIWSLRDSLLADSAACDMFLADNVVKNRQRVGFKVRVFPSGEATGAQFLTGSRSKVVPVCRSGEVVTSAFTLAARLKIRRASENAISDLHYFCTLTFAPSLEKNTLEGSNICHKYAKKELMRFLNTLSHTSKRRGNTLSYIWVAELQKNGNIHFHILMSQRFPIAWLTKIWGQESNSVDIEYIKDKNHAVNYMRKYLTKDEESLVKGNRYNISADLRETMKPQEMIICEMDSKDIQECGFNPVNEVHDLLNAFKNEIEGRGGRVLDFGFHLPTPRRPTKYKDKKTGEIKETRGISKNLAPSVLALFAREAENTPF